MNTNKLVQKLKAAEAKLQLAEIVLKLEREKSQRLSESHEKLRGSLAAIHNTTRLDGVSTSLSVIMSAARKAYEESAGIKLFKDE